DSRGSRPPRRAATYGCSCLRRWNKTHSQQRTRPPGRSSTHSQQCALPPIRTISAASDHPLTTNSICNYNCVSSTQQILSCILRETHDDAFGHSGHQRSSSDEEGRGRESAPPGIRRSRAARARGRRDPPPVRCARELLRRRHRLVGSAHRSGRLVHSSQCPHPPRTDHLRSRAQTSALRSAGSPGRRSRPPDPGPGALCGSGSDGRQGARARRGAGWGRWGAQEEMAAQPLLRRPIPPEAGGIPAPALLEGALEDHRAAGGDPGSLSLTLPDNPTGTAATRQSVEAVCSVAEAYGLVIISDEIYAEVCHDGSAPSALSCLPERTVVTS